MPLYDTLSHRALCVSWDSLVWRRRLEAEAGAPIFPIYLGDDVSDEDAFTVLRKRGGLPILINDGMVAREQTAAMYRLRAPREVGRLLARLAAARAVTAEANEAQPSELAKDSPPSA